MKNKKYLFIFSLILINILLYIFSFSSPDLRVIFFDVGQGDSIFIETPNKHQILIDGGPSSSNIANKLSSFMPFWDKTIDLIILTHLESDHVSGLFEVLDNYIVENILWSGEYKESEKSKIWKEMIEKENANIYISNSLDQIIMNDVHLKIIKTDGEITNTNDSSVITKLLYRDNSFLFTGDISSKVEKEIISQDIQSDIIKIPHHGSKYSSSEEFIKKVSPLLAVIQVGKNSYGHPTDEVLTRLSNFGIKVLRNDLDGDIQIVSNGIKYKIINKK
ncbi:MAG: MBL fold metallo-hydrolase [Candidatus Pacebacteria bacterium]|nr:MBL fold metallo-hydrolase [Candidatus Paceibacterota bacterium]